MAAVNQEQDLAASLVEIAGTDSIDVDELRIGHHDRASLQLE
jgi:hypothetical protein